MNIKKKIQEEKEVVKGERSKDKTYSSHQEFENKVLVEEAFHESVNKLFDVNKWSNLSEATASFQLYDNKGIEKQGLTISESDYIKINLPIPSPENWVKVIALKKVLDCAEFTVQPSSPPLSETDEVQHFFTSEATSTFKVEVKGLTVYAYEIGKNERINNHSSEAGDRKVINTLIAEGGWAGFQEFQWKKLTDYLVHKEDICHSS